MLIAYHLKNSPHDVDIGKIKRICNCTHISEYSLGKSESAKTKTPLICEDL